MLSSKGNSASGAPIQIQPETAPSLSGQESIDDAIAAEVRIQAHERADPAQVIESELMSHWGHGDSGKSYLGTRKRAASERMSNDKLRI
ncbi:hypothetical protein N7478_012898 [Penicillium angulare]|uniref:uncharacterized protein n=1 Tax=Penicillium angulare TaxID=116970 RepID=UPI0025400F61|nr:uncharacterized protein N7478_012898 [Penicillium angulare]KAJ5256794.1 hypothetical protein N7478_012898 [Penicillium angulare]